MAENKRGASIYDPPVGLVRTGNVIGYDPTSNTLQVQLSQGSAIGNTIPALMPGSFPYSDSDGMFIGAIPAKGTTVTVAQESGGRWHLVNWTPENLANIPNLNLGELLLYSTDTSRITLDLDSNIFLGSPEHNIHIFAGSQQYPKTNLITINFENENHINQAYREIGGVVKRDLRPNPQASTFSGFGKLEDDSYDDIYHLVGLDPQATVNDLSAGPRKNPALVEHREIVYEFQYKSEIDDVNAESKKYSTTAQATTINTTPNRRDSRSDTLSLTLLAPNFLIEQVKGTVVDVFGNILDINRNAIPVGLSSDTTLRTAGTVATTDAQQSYLNIRALERKSIAYHFEINARKDPNPTFPVSTPLDINADNYNAKLMRSRFFIDIDKEGQFKLNVPASSEVGNIPLLVRAENYSSFGTSDSSNPNQTWFTKSPNGTGQDVYLDSFAAPKIIPSASEPGSNILDRGSITIKDDKGAEATPIDRISQFVNNNPANIKHGTAYHDIFNACYYTKDADVLGYPTGGVDNIDLSYISSDTATNAANVSDTIYIAGSKANAGGRSGSINMDGSLEFNIGANTVDRQSLWLDTAGSVIAMLGRDKQQRSLMMDLDGHAFIQIGGTQSPTDARFSSKDTPALTSGILDIRVFNAGFTHILRFDEKGLIIMTPGRIGIHAGQGMSLTSDGEIQIDCESLIMQGRGVKKILGGSI